MDQTKKCCRCRETKPISDFNKDKHQKDGLKGDCRACRVFIRRKTDLYRKYNMSLRQYEKLFEKQGECCAICGTHQSKLKTRLCVDHDHIINKVRGLLCVACNRGLGYFKDDCSILTKANQYLRKAIL